MTASCHRCWRPLTRRGRLFPERSAELSASVPRSSRERSGRACLSNSLAPPEWRLILSHGLSLLSAASNERYWNHCSLPPAPCFQGDGNLLSVASQWISAPPRLISQDPGTRDADADAAREVNQGRSFRRRQAGRLN